MKRLIPTLFLAAGAALLASPAIAGVNPVPVPVAGAGLVALAGLGFGYRMLKRRLDR